MENSMSTTHYLVSFKAKQSSESPYGQKGAYPISGADLAYGYRSFSGIGDKKGETCIDTSYFGLLDKEHTHFDQDIIQELEAYVRKLTTTKMAPDTITLLEITTSDDSANYKVNASAEHPEALIGINNGGGLIITSDKATLSTIPEGGTEATFKTEIDFKNRRVNGK